MKTRSLLLLVVAILLSCISYAQTATVIPANEAAAHIGQYATVQGFVAKVFMSKRGNTFLNVGAAYPNQTFTGRIPPASPVSNHRFFQESKVVASKLLVESSCIKESRKFG